MAPRDGTRRFRDVARPTPACGEKHLRGFGGSRDALFSSGGSDAALAWLEEDKWRHAPEYVRPRPKYYYFYEMMREKIEAHYPPGSLPAPVMDKLLSTDADELDLLLQYPEAIRGQTEEYLAVLRERGAEALETYKTPTLTWDEVRALKGGDGVVGLGASGETTGAESVRDAKTRTKSFSSPLPLPALAENESSSFDVPSSRSVGSSALRSAKAKMDRAKAFAEAYAVASESEDSGKEKKQTSSFDDPECVSDPDEPEEDTDRAAVGAGGDDGLTDREKRGLTDGDGDGDGDDDVYGETVAARRCPDQRRAPPGFRRPVRLNTHTGEFAARRAREAPLRGSRRRRSRRWTRWIETNGSVLDVRRFILTANDANVHDNLFTSRSSSSAPVAVLLVARSLDPRRLREKPRVLPERDEPSKHLAPRRVVHGHRRRRGRVARRRRVPRVPSFFGRTDAFPRVRGRGIRRRGSLPARRRRGRREVHAELRSRII